MDRLSPSKRRCVYAFERDMINAIQQLCESRGCTVTALITELLQQELANGGRNIPAAIAHAPRAITGRRARHITPPPGKEA